MDLPKKTAQDTRNIKKGEKSEGAPQNVQSNWPPLDYTTMLIPNKQSQFVVLMTHRCYLKEGYCITTNSIQLWSTYLTAHNIHLKENHIRRKKTPLIDINKDVCSEEGGKK